MGRVIAVVNQKGGVGKTTTSINLAASLGVLNKKVLLVDLDPQGNATTGVGIDKGDINNSVYEVLVMKTKIEDAIIKTKSKNLSLLPAYLNLAGVDIELIELERKAIEEGRRINRVMRLKEEIAKVKDNYDYVFIDCPPSLGILTTNALAAADSVLIPVQCEYFALEGLGQLINTINLVKKHLNKSLEIEGAVLTMYDMRTNLSNQVVREVKRYFDDKVYKTVIPRNVKLSEAPSYGVPITVYDSRSKGAKCYDKLGKELIKNNEEQKAKHMK